MNNTDEFNKTSSAQRDLKKSLSIHEFIPPLHMGIISQTGGGKTVIGSEIFKQLPNRAIFFNYGLENYFKDVIEIQSINDLPRAMKKYRKVVVNIDDMKAIEDSVLYIWNLKKNDKWIKQNENIYLFFDECQMYSTLQFMTDVFNRGRRWHIHGIAMCREIQEMKNLRIISQCKHMIFLSVNDVGLNALRKNYSIKIPDSVLGYINRGSYKDGEFIFDSEYYSDLYDGMKHFIFDKNGEYVTTIDAIKVDDNVDNKEESDTGKRTNTEIPKVDEGDKTP